MHKVVRQFPYFTFLCSTVPSWVPQCRVHFNASSVKFLLKSKVLGDVILFFCCSHCIYDLVSLTRWRQLFFSRAETTRSFWISSPSKFTISTIEPTNTYANFILLLACKVRVSKTDSYPNCNHPYTAITTPHTSHLYTSPKVILNSIQSIQPTCVSWRTKKSSRSLLPHPAQENHSPSKRWGNTCKFLMHLSGSHIPHTVCRRSQFQRIDPLTHRPNN